MDLLSLFTKSDPQAQSRNHLTVLSQKLDVLLIHFGDSPTTADTHTLSPTVRAHLQRGDKIGAIKVYRNETGADLNDAKEAVEGKGEVADGVSWTEIEDKINRLMQIHGLMQPTPPQNTTTNRIIQLLKANEKIGAIKVYREANNTDLKEAKDAVDAIEAQLRAR